MIQPYPSRENDPEMVDNSSDLPVCVSCDGTVFEVDSDGNCQECD